VVAGPFRGVAGRAELELELTQTQMAQKPMLRAEVYAWAMRALPKHVATHPPPTGQSRSCMPQTQAA
jgi:hypothetical protein